MSAAAPVYISAYCDASFLYQMGRRGRCGWGAWLRDGATRLLVAEEIPEVLEWVKGSTQAELYAVYQTVHHALKHLDSETGTHLVVKTDCKGVVGWFAARKGCGARETEIVGACLDACEAAGVKLCVKWVRGHQRKDKNVTTYLNARVDELAKRAMMEGERVFWKRAIAE